MKNLSIVVDKIAPELLVKECKVVLRDIRKERPSLIKEEDEKEFLEVFTKMMKPCNDTSDGGESINVVKSEDSAVNIIKNEQEDNFLLVTTKPSKLPKPIKREVLKQNVFTFGEVPKSSFQCDVCQKYYKTHFLLKNHIERHFRPDYYRCEKCDAPFRAKGKLLKHKCGDRFCRFCKKKFNSSKNVQRHIRSVHADKLNINFYYCDKCGGNFELKSTLLAHLRYRKCEALPKFFVCDYCGKKVSNKNSMRYHVVNHSERIQCALCDKTVKRLSMYLHMQIVHRDDKVECKICKKIYKNPKLLKLHERIHDKKFKCEKCDCYCINKSTLKRHQKIHKKFK